MFGFLQGKKKEKQPESQSEAIARELFGQISEARDEARTGGIVTEQAFNDRLNTMFVAGYLIGYVDQYLEELNIEDTAEKKAEAECIFETMFPGSGMSFVKTKLAARKKAAEIPKGSEVDEEVVRQCSDFDKGMAAAEEEVTTLHQDEARRPERLKGFLLLGEF